MDGQDRPYLFPVPAAVLRGGLNLRAQLGEEFSEDEAVCDIMLDLDRMDARHPPAQRLQKLHSVRYYAERWGWSKSQVQRGLSGDKRRGLPAFLIERARGFRAFFGRPANPESRPDSPRPGDGFGDSGGHPGDSGGQKAAYSMRSGPIWGQGGDSGGHPGDKEDQTTNTLVGGESSARAREGGSSPSRGKLYEHPAVRAYERAAEVQAPVVHAEAVVRHFGAEPDADRLARWAEHVTTWRVTPRWNERNIPDMIRAFDESESRARESAERAASRAGGSQPVADEGRGGSPLGSPRKGAGGAGETGRRHGKLHGPRGEAERFPEIRGTAAERATVRTARANLESLNEWRRAHPELYGGGAEGGAVPDEDGSGGPVARLGTGL